MAKVITIFCCRHYRAFYIIVNATRVITPRGLTDNHQFEEVTPAWRPVKKN